MKKIWKYKLIGLIGYIISKVIFMTVRIKFIRNEEYDFNKNYAYAFWHGKLLYSTMVLTKEGKETITVVSPSKDGEIITTILKMMNYDVLRGSSDKESVKTLVGLIRGMKEGKNAGFGIDGPKGPIHKVKSGMLYASKKTGVEILPIGAYSSSKWIFNKAWDKFEIPKPFSTIIYVIGKPYKIGDSEEVDNAAEILNKKIDEAEEYAEKVGKGEIVV